MPPEDAERARPFRLHIYEGFCRRNHDHPLKCSDSSRRSASLSPFRTSGGLIWGPLAASFGVSSLFFLLSSLFSPLSSLLPCGGGTVPERVGSPLAASLRDLWRPLRVSLLSSLFSLRSALFSLCSLPSSLAAAHFSDRTSHLPLRSLHQAIDVAPNCFDPLRLPPWPGGMREAIRRPLGGVLDKGTRQGPSKISSNLQAFEFLSPP